MLQLGSARFSADVGTRSTAVCGCSDCCACSWWLWRRRPLVLALILSAHGLHLVRRWRRVDIGDVAKEDSAVGRPKAALTIDHTQGQALRMRSRMVIATVYTGPTHRVIMMLRLLLLLLLWRWLLMHVLTGRGRGLGCRPGYRPTGSTTSQEMPMLARWLAKAKGHGHSSSERCMVSKRSLLHVRRGGLASHGSCRSIGLHLGLHLVHHVQRQGGAVLEGVVDVELGAARTHWWWIGVWMEG